ncbi:winged helix-turn-helix transcriptional regulator [Candidatus Nitrospira salsa]
MNRLFSDLHIFCDESGGPGPLESGFKVSDGLTNWGLVTRKDYREIPPRVEYWLSTLGQSLEGVLMAMHEWGERYGQKALQKKGR